MLNMKNNIFKKARLKLTAYYVGIMFIILAIFSSVLIYIIDSKINEGLNDKVTIIDPEDNPLDHVNTEINLYVLYIDGALLIIIAFSSYFLAGKTLKPIQENLDAQKKFLADASHDLRTPLAIIITGSEVVLNNKTSSQKDFKDSVESNLEEAKSMSNLVNNLLAIAKGENENTLNDFVISDLHNVINKIVSKMIFKAESKGLKLEIDEYKKILVKIDINNFERALSNLLQNAINYTKTGTVKVSLEENSKKVTITIKDTGIGINEQDLPYIFDRFYKAENSRNDESGSGLGLCISKQIIEQHKGDIKINSTINVGTIVTVTMPKVLVG